MQNLGDVDTMKEELEKYHFRKMNVVDHYDPEHKIHSFYMKERKRAYEHKPLGDEEKSMLDCKKRP